jgi:signal transduction histidine kinase
MKLATRMWLSGALLPCAVLAGALSIANGSFEHALGRSLDQALLAQAAVETASMFDLPGNLPHLHMARSPMMESVRPFAPRGALFGPDGAPLAHYPEREEYRDERLLPKAVGAPPELVTIEEQGLLERSLLVSVRGPDGQPYTLRLLAPLGQVEAAKQTFQRLAFLVVGLSGLLLVVAQGVQSRALERRLKALATHVEALRAGELERPLEPDSARDEISDLRAVLSQATSSLRFARDSRNRFIADAAHELRTPLTLMRTSLDLALRKPRSTDELREALRETREEVVRLSTLAANLLDVAALTQPDALLELCDLRALTTTSIDAARDEAAMLGRTLTIEAPAPCFVRGRPEALRRAVDNLLANALKYAAHTIAIQVTTHDGRASVSVHDDGPGIACAERELVFDPFHRAPGSAPGSGLGLTLVREVAKAHGGSAFVADAEHGARVVIELPSATEAA